MSAGRWARPSRAPATPLTAPDLVADELVEVAGMTLAGSVDVVRRLEANLARVHEMIGHLYASPERLWWRCRLCRGRFDTFGTAHDDADDRRAAAAEALFHFDHRQRLHLDSLDEALAQLEPAGRTSRVVRPTLQHPFDGT